MTNDPWPYDGPIERADGRRPYNRYLWPLGDDDWWAYDTFGHRGVSERFHFCVIALAPTGEHGPRWSTSGFVWEIERNAVADVDARPVVFDTREKAVRIAAARFIRMCRHARRWNGPNHLTEERCAQLIGWALEIAGRPGEVALRPLPPVRKPTGLPLFDVGVSA